MLNRLNKRSIIKRTALSGLFVFLLYFIIPVSPNLFPPNYSTVIKAENGTPLHIFINSQEQWYLPPETHEIPEKLKTAVIVFEDEQFYNHWGVNIKAIIRAIGQNFSQNRVVSGASTIPMQIARMARPKKRTYFNKFKEIGFALKLSMHYSKNELLKYYLDHAPYGGNVIGYRTASLKFYGKEAEALTWSEAATLAVLPNAPGLIYPSTTSSLLKEKRNLLLKKLFDKGYITEQSFMLAKLESVPEQFIPFDSHAPHLARKLKTKYPSQWIINTTIDDRLQQQCNRIAARYKQIYAPYSIYNLSIIVTDTKSGAVRAYVGSADFFDRNHSGQVDGVQAPRSSGSTLKPFLFALSMDEGLILPDSYIRDLPTYFDGFSPRNANHEYQGVVTAKEALVQSLNIPAVRLLNSYGVYQFYSFLKLSGVSTLFRTSDEYGLPLVLGGAEVTLWDLSMLYRGLANNGVFHDNYLVADEQRRTTPQLISKGSCYLTLDMLKDLKRPGSEYYWERFNNTQPLAWKTGTSFGHKDAWAVGVNPDYTIAVWCGNFNGVGNKNLGGTASAGPILFDILQLLPQQDANLWFEKNEIDFKPMKVCSLSGFRANEACPETHEIMVPFGMKPLPSCDYHQFNYYSLDGSYLCCSRCWDRVGSIKKSATVYPPDIAYYLREKGQYIENMVGHYPECPAYTHKESLQIIYPNLEAKLFLPRDFDGKIQPVICKVGHTNSSTKVYWYLNDFYLGMTTGEHKMPVLFNTGWNTLKVIDETGSEDSQRVFAAQNL